MIGRRFAACLPAAAAPLGFSVPPQPPTTVCPMLWAPVRTQDGLGWKPPAGCDATVGQIQQTINTAFTAGKLGKPDDPAGSKAAIIESLMPLDVDGRVGAQTQQAMFVLVPEYDMQFGPATTLRQLRQKYGVAKEAAFACPLPPAAPPPPDSGMPTWLPAAIVGAAAIGIAAVVSRRTA